MEGPAKVTLVEVGPRDGLQNEKTPIALEHKLALIERLAACGLKVIEATAFVSPQWVPQMADHAEVMRALRGRRRPGVRHPVLVPNLKGLEAALAAGVDEIAVFGAASETFSRKNINCGIAEALERFRPVVAQARAAGVRLPPFLDQVAAVAPLAGQAGMLGIGRVGGKEFAAAAAEQRIMNSYQAGLSAYTNVVSAQASTLGARRALLQLQLQRQQAALALIEALGGGWQAPWAAAGGAP